MSAADYYIDYAYSNKASVWSHDDIARRLHILDKEQRLIPYVPNAAQLHFRANKTGRDIILKARQLGFSTEIQASHFVRAVTSTVMAATLAHDADTTQKLRRMAKRFYDSLPDYLRPDRSMDNATTTAYSTTGSEVTIATAGSVNVGRGGTYSLVHGSEVAFWRDAESIIAGILQGVPRHGEIVMESTPNGATGWFYDRCMEALSGEGVWTLHFYEWWWDDSYQMPLDDGEVIDYTLDELSLVEHHGLTPEQIKWRRFKRKELGRLFPQEYPESPVDCFLRSGGGFFSTIPHLPECFAAPANVTPDTDHRIVAGLDLGQSDDYTALSIIDADTGRELRLHRVNKMSWSDIWRRVGRWCADCGVNVLVLEVNTLGGIDINDVLRQLREAGFEGSILRFKTTAKSKPALIAGLYQALDAQDIALLPDHAAKQEMYDFTSKQTPSGAWKYEAATGHDDTVIARALAWHGINRPTARLAFG